MQQRGSPTVAGSLPASMVEKKGGGRLADSPYDNHIRPVRTTVLKLLVEEKRGGGLDRGKTTPGKRIFTFGVAKL